MIFQLLSTIAQTLQTHLSQPAQSIVVSEGTLILPDQFPYIRLLPSHIHFLSIGQDKGTVVPRSTQFVIVREFQQEFAIEIYDSSIAQLEQWLSLIVGILFASHDTLIQNYNQRAPRTEYNAAPFHTLHNLKQIQILEALPLSIGTVSGLKLRANAIGQMTITQVLAEGTIPIAEISLNLKSTL